MHDTIVAESDCTELSFWMAITRRLPRLRGAGALAELIRSVYLRKPRPLVRTRILGNEMILDPTECIDGGILFYPQIFDHHEISYMRSNLSDGDVFLDAGAHIGFYTLIAAGLVGKNGRVISIEANPNTAQKLEQHVNNNAISNTTIVQRGLSDKMETLRLGTNTGGNIAGSSFLSQSKTFIEIQCDTLFKTLEDCQISKIRGAKFDIEGYEFRVLNRFLNEAPRTLFPEFMIIEDNPEWAEGSGGSAMARLESAGYSSIWNSKLNHILMLRP